MYDHGVFPRVLRSTRVLRTPVFRTRTRMVPVLEQQCYCRILYQWGEKIQKMAEK